MDGPAWASLIAPEVDRLALCIHRPAGRRPELRSALDPLGLPPQSFVVPCARSLAAGRITVEDVFLMARYLPRQWAQVSVDAHVSRGLLAPGPDGAYSVSRELAGAARVVLGIQAEEAGRLWAPAGDGLVGLASLAGTLVAAAEASEINLPAFRQQLAVHHMVPDSTAGGLLGRITELRYLRSDVHAFCLASEDLSGAPAQTLHRLWRGVGPGDASGRVVDELAEQGLCSPGDDGWSITDRGVRVCTGVEEATNTRIADLLVPVGADVCESFLVGLRMLAGEDPRPAEDR
ncbi:MAG: helix-turn-helix domain-containing protein [Acidimicrobiales bacterium]